MQPVTALSPSSAKVLAAEQNIKNIPPEVIKAVNEMIVSKMKGRLSAKISVKIRVDELIKKITELTGRDSKYIYDNHWLDFEPIFEMSGWIVKYDKPGYNEDYPSSFTFTEK